MTIEFVPQGVCPRYMKITAQDDIITEIQIFGGCEGNLQAITRLVEGMRVADAIEKLADIDCGGRGTSCPDQIATALRQLMVDG